MTDPRDVPGWVQKRAPPDDSEFILLRKMQGDGYSLAQEEISGIYTRLGGAEHIEMIEILIRNGFCVEENDDDTTTWKLTDQGREALENA